MLILVFLIVYCIIKKKEGRLMRNKKGFTIIELMAVILIIGMLSSIAIISISKNRTRVNEKEKVTLRASIIDAFNNYRISNSVGENGVKIEDLKFNDKITYNNNECDLTDNDTIKYVVKGDYLEYFKNDEDDKRRIEYGVCMTETTIENNETVTSCMKDENGYIPSKEEAFCVKLSCGVNVIDDYKDESSICRFAK